MSFHTNIFVKRILFYLKLWYLHNVWNIKIRIRERAQNTFTIFLIFDPNAKTVQSKIYGSKIFHYSSVTANDISYIQENIANQILLISIHWIKYSFFEYFFENAIKVSRSGHCCKIIFWDKNFHQLFWSTKHKQRIHHCQ
jgi:hypothetical protein